jgi:DNA sulfur modification protein DndB
MTSEEGFQYRFTALRGIQAGREYYVVMCPLRLIPKIFLFDEEELSAELRAQRTLNKARVPEIARYVAAYPKDYVFSSITASVDGDVSFEPFEKDENAHVGRLVIPMTARFIINDGQHRRAAIEEALKERPELERETISVVLFVDAGLLRSQQMFADLNRHAIRPTRSLGILYDHRDELSKLACRLAEEVPIFRGLTELERTTISNRSRKLFTLSSIHLATRRLLRKGSKGTPSSAESGLAREFWTEVGKNMPDWQAVADRKVATGEMRRDYVHAHGLALQALASAGADLIAADPARWKPRLKALRRLDWARSNTSVWEGKATVHGRVTKAETNIQLTADVIRDALGIPTTGVRPAQEKTNGRQRPRPRA